MLIIEEVYSSHCKCELCKLIDGTKNVHLKKQLKWVTKSLQAF